MSARHTPGPWSVDGIASVKGTSSLDYPITDQRGLCVAHVIFNEDGGDNREECHADANLIAAAPELLEALERLNLVIGLTPIKGNLEAVQDACDIARAAIAKAKGETK